MFSHIADRIAEAPGESLFTATVMVAAGALMVAFYLVCSGQVQRADQRESALRTQRLAMADCLETSRNSTWASCATQHAGAASVEATPSVQPADGFIRASIAAQPVQLPTAKATVGAMTPVSFYR